MLYQKKENSQLINAPSTEAMIQRPKYCMIGKKPNCLSNLSGAFYLLI